MQQRKLSVSDADTVPVTVRQPVKVTRSVGTFRRRRKTGFEGGQTSLARRMPKRGFNNIFATEYTVVNVADLEARFENGAVIDTDALIDAGLVTKVLDGVKVLGNGEVTKSFTVKAAKFSESAKAKIESAGGKAEVE